MVGIIIRIKRKFAVTCRLEQTDRRIVIQIDFKTQDRRAEIKAQLLGPVQKCAANTQPTIFGQHRHGIKPRHRNVGPENHQRIANHQPALLGNAQTRGLDTKETLERAA